MTSFHKFNAIIVIYIFLLSSTILSGCTFKDIDKRTFVVAIGIDPGETDENKYKVTLKFALPVGSIKEATSQTYSYMSHESDSMSDAIRYIESKNDKVIEFGHTRLIVINEKLLGSNIGDFMDYFTRRGDIQLISWVAAAKPSAAHILKAEPKTESTASMALFNFFDNNGTDSPFIVTTFLFEFRRQYFAKGIDAVIPLIETDEDNTELIINKSLIVKAKHEPYEFDSLETLYYNTVANDASGYSYRANINDFSILMFINNTKMKYKIIIEDGSPPRVDIKIKGVGSVIESTKPLDKFKLDDYSKLAEADLETVFKDLLIAAQENNLDPMGFGLRYRATRLNDKNTFAEWEEMYPNLQFNIDLDLEIRSIGAVE